MFSIRKIAKEISPTFYEAWAIVTVIVAGLGIVITNERMPRQTYSYYFLIVISLAALAATSFHCGKAQQRKKNGKTKRVKRNKHKR